MQKTLAADLTVRDWQQLWHGVRLLRQDKPFEAHECFEEAFRARDGAVRTLFRALTQLSASYYQLRLGRARAARSTFLKACLNLELIDLLSTSFQSRVEQLFAQYGAGPSCDRFSAVIPEAVVLAWPVPDALHSESPAPHQPAEE